MSFREKKIAYLNEKAKKIRELTVECIGKLGFGHIGGASSICETLAALYFDIMHVDPEIRIWRTETVWCCPKAMRARLSTRRWR